MISSVDEHGSGDMTSAGGAGMTGGYTGMVPPRTDPTLDLLQDTLFNTSQLIGGYFISTSDAGCFQFSNGSVSCSYSNSSNSSSPVMPARNCSGPVPVPPTYPAAFVQYKIIVDVFIVGFLCFAGFLGNALSIVVLYRDRREDDKRNTTNWLLQALAIVDTLYLASCVAIQPVKTVYDLTDWAPGPSILRRTFPYVEPHAWAVASIAQTSTVWLVMLVTIDRYVAVCHPWSTEWRTKSRAKLAVVVVVVLAAIYNIPRFFERQVVYTVCDDEQIVRTVRTPLRSSRVYFLVYKTVCYFVFRSIGPLAILVILNVRLVRALQVVRKKRREMAAAKCRQQQQQSKKRRRRRESLTLILVTVVTVFIVCELPDLCIRIAFTAAEFAGPSRVPLDIHALRYANVASNALLSVNSAVNFLIYCLVGKKFRRILLHMFSCRVRRDRSCIGGGGGGGGVTREQPTTRGGIAECTTAGGLDSGETVSAVGGPPRPPAARVASAMLLAPPTTTTSLSGRRRSAELSDTELMLATPTLNGKRRANSARHHDRSACL